jgi:hypothetical protein
MNRANISGQKFNRLTVLSFSHVDEWGNAVWNCKCDCGNLTQVGKWRLSKGYTKSCGCLIEENRAKALTTHGHTKKTTGLSREYKAWMHMKQRCSPKTLDKRKDYFERGIAVSERWLHSFENFFVDMGKCPPGMTLDRIDNDKGYSKENCRWASNVTQCNNQRSNVWWEYGGQRLTIIQWARELGVKPTLLRGRRALGWPVDKILSTPDLKNRRWFKRPANA